MLIDVIKSTLREISLVPYPFIIAVSGATVNKIVKPRSKCCNSSTWTDSKIKDT
jgi:hypothetical protein